MINGTSSSIEGQEPSSSLSSGKVEGEGTTSSKEEVEPPLPPVPSIYEGDIKGVLELGENLKKEAVYNDLGYCFSEVKVKFTGRSFFYGPMVSSMANAGNPYWSLMGDKTGYLYVAIPASLYEGNAKKYAGQQNQYFEVEGALALFEGRLIVEATSYAFLASPSFLLSDEEMKGLIKTDPLSVKEIHARIKGMDLNIKGCSYGELVKVDAKCVAKMDEHVYLFHDGHHYLKVHGTKTALSGLSAGKAYRLYLAIDEYIYAPGGEILFHEEIETALSDPLPYQTVKASDTYQWTYVNNKKEHASRYEGAFPHAYVAEGYVTYYQKDGAVSFVLSDTPKPSGFLSYTGARDAKCLFFKNKSETNLKTELDLSYSRLNAFPPESKVSVTFVPYLWNSMKYFQGYLLDVKAL